MAPCGRCRRLCRAATATASYSLGAIDLMATVAVAEEGGADSSPFPYDHPCRAQLKGAVGYDVQFLTLRTICIMGDGERKAVKDVPQGVRVDGGGVGGLYRRVGGDRVGR